MIEKLHLLGGSFHALTVYDELIGIKIDHELIEYKPLFRRVRRGLRLAAAHDGVDARHQLLDLKRLRDVIVRAHFKSGDLVERFALRGQHDDRHIGGLPNLGADDPAVHDRQHDVEQDEIRLQLLRAADALTAVGGEKHVEPVLFEIQAQQLRNVAVVLNYQYFFCHICSLPVCTARIAYSSKLLLYTNYTEDGTPCANKM